MTIEDSLILLDNTKQAIKTAIENKGVVVGAAPFADYAGKINDISTGIGLPDIGDAFEGGYFMGLTILPAGVYALVLSAYADGESGLLTFKNANTEDLGAQDILDGAANTASINDSDHPGAQYVTGLTIGGHSDWFVPSMVQLSQAMCYSVNNGWSASSNVSDPRGFRVGPSLTYSASAQYANANRICLYISRYTAGGRNGASVGSSSVSKTETSYFRAFRQVKLD